MAIEPEQRTHQEATAVPMAALIAWQALFNAAQLQAGQTVFIPGGAGGVGHLAIQLTKLKVTPVEDERQPINVEGFFYA